MQIKKTIGKGFIILLFSTASYAFYTQQGNIYNEANHQIKIDGISWSGFQDSMTFQGLASNPFHTLEGSAMSQSKRYGMLEALIRPWSFPALGLDKTNSVSFKTVRLPIQPGVLYDNQSRLDINRSLTNKLAPTQGNGIFCKTWETQGTTCSQTVTPREAFWKVLEEFKKNKVNVLIDFHHRYGYGDSYRDGTVYSLFQYEADLTLLVKEIKTRNLTNVIGIDLFNEPFRLSWFRDNGQPTWINVIASAAKVIKRVDPNLLVFVEGAGPGTGDPDQAAICIKDAELIPDEAYTISSDSIHCVAGTKRVEFKGNWGEDFKPLLDENNAKRGIPRFNRNTFIQQLKRADLDDTTIAWLLGDANANKAHIVFSPHVYPREVATWESSPGKPSELRFDWTWGFLKKAGFSVVLGEASWKTDDGLSFFQHALAPYLIKNQMRNDLFFWGVGYLGDTISLIDPNQGTLNLQAEQTLHQLFNQTL